MNWNEAVTDLQNVLKASVVTGDDGTLLNMDQGFAQLVKFITACKKERRRVYFVGNGASASMASHYSADLAKMSGVPTEVFTDPALITATGNDFGYDQAFAYPLAQRVVSGEVLIAVSSSGNSPNAVNAIRTVKERGGVVVTFTAMSGDNAMRKLGDLNFYMPAKTYGMAESGHAAMLHHMVDQFGTAGI